MYNMSSPETHDVSSQQTNEQITQGRVKWFNNKAGYGFITVSSTEHNGEDVFVHHTAIQVGKEQYRYLVQGEYVTFKLCEVTDATHKWQAGEVKGVDGGRLMCETRLESRETRMTRHETPDESSARRPTRYVRDGESSQHRIRYRGQGPREGDEWMLVRRRSNQSARGGSTQSPGRDVVRSRTNDRNKYRDGDN